MFGWKMNKILFSKLPLNTNTYLITVKASANSSRIGYSNGKFYEVFGSLIPNEFMGAPIYYLITEESKTEIWAQSDLRQLKITRLDTNESCICEEDDKDPGQYEVYNASFFTSADIEKKNTSHYRCR